MREQESDFDDAPVLGLQRYVRAVAVAMGVTGECSFVEPGPPAGAYLAVEGHAPTFPGRDIALVWDEERGWAVAVETRAGDDLAVLAHLGGEVLPRPAEVREFVDALLRGEHPGDPRPIRLRTVGADDDLLVRLSGYPA
ncbi:DUF6292 family protein [Saccharothrix sp. Mg75]|uniref:DUF6292 family protein n=1 Tax=Saccharothrix sp. Mg75 TaxID=3445357 RepID=UPI003EE90E95